MARTVYNLQYASALTGWQIAKLMDYCAAEEDEWDAKFEQLFEEKFEQFVDGEEHKIECARPTSVGRSALACPALADRP